MRKILIHGIVASFLASLNGIIYLKVYQSTLNCGFTKIINPISISAASTIGCSLITVGYLVLLRLKKEEFKGWLNILISVLSFASIIGPISTSLPLEISNPELFPGLIAPMHFFPALAFFAISPLFNKIS